MTEFVCEVDEDYSSACKGLEFYGEHEGNRYCVLNFPDEEKNSDDFLKVVKSKLMQKDYDFSGTVFPKRPANFKGFDFDANADFGGAIFPTVADFSGAKFSGKADFTGAQFIGVQADFSKVQFNGEKTDFSRAELSSGEVTDFTEAELSGERTDFT